MDGVCRQAQRPCWGQRVWLCRTGSIGSPAGYDSTSDLETSHSLYSTVVNPARSSLTRVTIHVTQSGTCVVGQPGWITRRRHERSSSREVAVAWVEHTSGEHWRVRYRRSNGTIASEGGFTSRTAAQNRAQEIEVDQHRHVFYDPGRADTPLTEWLTRWWPTARRRRTHC